MVKNVEHHPDRRYTLEEFFAMAGEERVELFEGCPVWMSRASFQHEGVVANLIGEITSTLKGGPCMVFGSNLQVVFPFQNEKTGDKNISCLPDISVVCERNKLRNKRCYGAPDLVVEVLSPSTARVDRLLKRRYYEKFGVKEYWIVDVHNQYLEKYTLQNGSLIQEDVYDQENESFSSTLFPEMKFNMKDIFGFMKETEEED